MINKTKPGDSRSGFCVVSSFLKSLNKTLFLYASYMVEDFPVEGLRNVPSVKSISRFETASRKPILNSFDVCIVCLNSLVIDDVLEEC